MGAGMKAPRTRARLASGTVALPVDEFARLAERSDNAEQLVQLVRAYFA